MTELERPRNNDKTSYFSHKAVQFLAQMRLSKEGGLFATAQDYQAIHEQHPEFDFQQSSRLAKKESWRNVVEHELVESEVVDVIAEMLGLSEEQRKKLVTAAILHDIDKRKEMGLIKEKGLEGSVEAVSWQQEKLRCCGYSEEVLAMVKEAGDISPQMFADFDNTPLEYKIIHYSDDITKGCEVVLLDERIDSLEANPKYFQINEEGRGLFNGMTYFEAQRKIGHMIESEIASRIGLDEPKNLPKIILERIAHRIGEYAKTLKLS